MLKMRTRIALAVCGIAIGLTAPAQAQDSDVSLRGIRIEANAGGDRLRSAFTHDNSFGYGGTIGFDGMIGDRFVVGAEGSVWRPENDETNCATGPAGTFCNTSRYELGAAVRAGYLVTPRLLVFGKGGYAFDNQRNVFTSSNALFYQNGTIVQAPASFTREPAGSGYQVGGGAEYSFTDMFYVNAQYVYSRYDNDTSRQRVMAGVGVRFR